MGSGEEALSEASRCQPVQVASLLVASLLVHWHHEQLLEGWCKVQQVCGHRL